MRLIVGTRGSKLAIAQTEEVIESLKKAIGDIEIEKKIIKTHGDKFLASSLIKIGERGIFTKELDIALLQRKIDFAVHSLKDLPTKLTEGVEIAAIPKRSSPYDVFFSLKGIKLEKIPPNSVVGTSSIRRKFQILNIRKDLNIKPIRGNVDTRIKKVLKGEYDGVILAEAGIKRLKLKIKYQKLNFLPAPGQGALAVTCRKNSTIAGILKKIEDKKTRYEVIAERTVLSKLGGGCHIPVGVLAKAENEKLRIRGIVIGEGKIIEASIKGRCEDYIQLGEKLAQKLLDSGAENVIFNT